MIFLKPKITNLIRENTFLPNTCPSDGNWIATDSPSNYEELLTIMPSDWFYRTNTVHYKVNKHHYRTAEFDSIDWANSVVLVGCSQTYGVGITEEHTISYVLSNLIGKPVINLGFPGASNNLISTNSVLLHAKYPSPLAVVHIWSGQDRTTYYNTRDIKNHGPWSLTAKHPYMEEWSEDSSHAEVQTLMASKIVNQVWTGKSKIIEVTNFSDTYKTLKCDYIRKPLRKDYARDNMHFGINTAKFMAGQIATRL